MTLRSLPLQEKWKNTPTCHFLIFSSRQPLKNVCPLNSSVHGFVKELGRRRISVVTGDPRETSFVYQRLSVSLQRFDSVLVSETFVVSDAPADG